eukprot:gene11545-12591_t
MTGLLAKEPSVLKIAILAELFSRRDFSLIKLGEDMRNHRMRRKMSARRDQILLTGLGMKLGETGRGICNYDSGLCWCFTGFYGTMCEHQTTLI